MANDMSVNLTANASAFAAGVDGAKAQIISMQRVAWSLSRRSWP